MSVSGLAGKEKNQHTNPEPHTYVQKTALGKHTFVPYTFFTQGQGPGSTTPRSGAHSLLILSSLRTIYKVYTGLSNWGRKAISACHSEQAVASPVPARGDCRCVFQSGHSTQSCFCAQCSPLTVACKHKLVACSNTLLYHCITGPYYVVSG